MKTAFVTGASRGIGRAVAELLAVSGYSVLANFFSTPLAPSANITPVYGDVRNGFENIEADLLVNNAGISLVKQLQDTTADDWDDVMAVNLRAAFLCSKAALPYMLRRKSGCIISISSIWGVEGGSCEVAYSASKAGLIGFTKALAKELEPSNIRVNAVAPGAIDTDMNKGIDLSGFRVGTPSDVAKAVLFLAEHASITGTVMEV